MLTYTRKVVELFTRHGLQDNTISSWLNYALRGDEAVYWVSKGQLRPPKQMNSNDYNDYNDYPESEKADSRIFVAKTFQIKRVNCVNFQIRDKCT